MTVAGEPAAPSGGAGPEEGAEPASSSEADVPSPQVNPESAPGQHRAPDVLPGSPQSRPEPAPAVAATSAATRPSGGRRVLGWVRSILSTLLIVVGVLGLVLSPLAIWGRNLLLNTDRYVQTLAPLASNPGVQSALVAAVDRQVDANLDVSSLVEGALPPKAAKALSGPLQNAVSGLVNTVATTFVQSKAFATIWTEMNRVAHEQIDNLLTGKTIANGQLKTKAGKIALDLTPIVQQVKTRLVAAGITVAGKVPTVGATLEIANVKGLAKAQKAVRALNTIADWLPWIGLALVAAGVALARRRRRATMRAAIGLGAGMIIIAIGLLIGRHIYLSEIPTNILPHSTAASIFDTLVRYLRWGIRLVFLVALLIALGLWVTGASGSATAVRRGLSTSGGRAGRGLRDGPVGDFVTSYANVLRVAIIAIGGIVLLLIDGPSLATIIVLAVIVVLLLVAVQLLRAPSPPAPVG
jgi:LPXTG-motif cell wall-anchored protein